MPFANLHHGGDEDRPSLAVRVEIELRARIEDALDYACLDAMVRARKAEGAPPPLPDNATDRAEYLSRVSAFMERVRAELVPTLTDEQRRRLGATVSRRPANVDAALAAQIALAKELPDYWQRLDAIRQRDGALDSGSEHRTLLDWFLGR
jgi:hypothetical protein